VKTLRIAFLGDSMTNGTGDPEMLGWVGRICVSARTRGHDVTAYNPGIRRNTSEEIAARWYAEATARLPPDHPRACVFCFGVNDCVEENGAPRVSLHATLVHAESMLLRAETLGPVLLIGPPPIDDEPTNARIRVLDTRLQMLAMRLGIPFRSTLNPLLGTPTGSSRPAPATAPTPPRTATPPWPT